MNKAKVFLERIPSTAPPVAAEHVSTSWAIFDRATAAIASVRGDGELSNAGKAAQIERELKGPLDHLRQIRADISKRYDDAHGQRAVLRQRVTTSDAFSEARLQEVRTWLRSLSQAERMQAMQGKDELIMQAIVSAPHYLSSTPQCLWEATVEAAVEARFPGAMAQIEALETAFETASASAQLALDDIRRASELPADDFAKLAA